MSTTTTNYGMFKPDLSDPADITKMNPNWDTIDAELYNTVRLDPHGKVPINQIPNMILNMAVDIPTDVMSWYEYTDPSISDYIMHAIDIEVEVPDNFNFAHCDPLYGIMPQGNYVSELEEEMFSLIKGLVTDRHSVTIYATDIITHPLVIFIFASTQRLELYGN